ncbi:MAG: hypothetical protein H0X25_06875 [Acidobacteriales bacterium]|nr:hypothetical protein [Terriglobales bacterium]
MRSAIMVAVLVLATAFAWGQRGVGAARGGFAPRASFGYHLNAGGIHINTGFPAAHGSWGYSPYLYGYVNPPYSSFPYGGAYYGYPYYAQFYGGYPYRRGGYRGYGSYAYGAYAGYGYAGYAGYGYPYGVDSFYTYDTQAGSDQSSQTQQLSNQVNQLTYEVQRLREDQQLSRATPPQPPPPPSPPTAAPGSHHKPQAQPIPMTKLIFLDGHTEEVGDYAIVGQTLWIFNEQRAVKVPMGRIDVPATERANEERGVDFVVPR